MFNWLKNLFKKYPVDANCVHGWSKWRVSNRGYTFFYQERECLICGLREQRRVGSDK